MAPQAYTDKIVADGKRRYLNRDQGLSQVEKANITAHLGYLDPQTKAATLKTQQNTIAWLLEKVPNALLLYLCCKSQPRTIQKTGEYRNDRKLDGHRLRAEFVVRHPEPCVLEGPDWYWLRAQFCNPSDYGLERRAVEGWLESLCPPKARKVRLALRNDRRHVCTIMLDQVEKNSLADLQKLSCETWEGFVPPQLISSGASKVFPSIETMRLPNDILGQRLGEAHTKLSREAKCLSVSQLPPVSNHCERVTSSHRSAGFWVTKALVQRSQPQANDQPLTVVVDAILDGPML